ncbi:thiolase family protein [Psychrobacillus sp. OK032]|uniref:thiolase family protein n=1 Tax=Psychrobacillus sp. OK032 TaxID=1884358 RepID=UPI0008BF1DE0|nr:thiolase family protein [Psychrobacillus sp. OK032]SER81845.1 Acetyl-CoA acetyltransferase [Psychrobacillus sp. OK032]
MENLSEKYCIIGVGQTKYGKHPGRTTIDMNVEAIKNAIEDCGIDKSSIDAVLCKYPTSTFSSFYSLQVAQAIGIVPKVSGVIDMGGASNINLIQYAITSMELGQCETAVISFADNPLTGSRNAYTKPWGDSGVHGWFGTPPAYGMIAQRHMDLYGTKSEQLGAIAVAAHKHAALNPNAQSRKEITIEDHQNSKFIARPLHLYDCCLVSDGGAAVIVTSVENAKKLGVSNPVTILGLGQSHPSWDIELRKEITVSGAKESGRMAFEMAGLRPQDMDFAQIYDCFSIVNLITLEDYGFCEKGEGGSFVENGRIELGGALPVNTSGGLLSETGMPGMQLIIEGVRQIRGECSDRQVPDAKLGIISNQGGIMSTHATMILGR